MIRIFSSWTPELGSGIVTVGACVFVFTILRGLFIDRGSHTRLRAGRHPLLAVRGCSNHRNRRHIADIQPADVNVGYGVSSLNNPMSAFSLLEALAIRV